MKFQTDKISSFDGYAFGGVNLEHSRYFLELLLWWKHYHQRYENYASLHPMGSIRSMYRKSEEKLRMALHVSGLIPILGDRAKAEAFAIKDNAFAEYLAHSHRRLVNYGYGKYQHPEADATRARDIEPWENLLTSMLYYDIITQETYDKYLDLSQKQDEEKENDQNT